MTSIACQEWHTYSPENTEALRGLHLDDPVARAAAADLAATERLTILDLRHGLHIVTGPYVGTLRLGDLRLTIQPKIQGMPLLVLLRYAYGLRNLRLLDVLAQGVEAASFQDLLIHQLCTEADELLARGLHRRYMQRSEALASPRGKINFAAIARQAVLVEAALPCTHHPRLVDNTLNRMVLASLRLAIGQTGHLGLRVQLETLAARLAGAISATRLTPELLKQVHREANRLTAAYQPVRAIAALLLEGQGTALQPTATQVPVPGFLFDMNRFFQMLMLRFLRDGLPDHVVCDERRIFGMLAYDPERNPRRRQAPAPRPDFVVLYGGKPVALLDAKYRDLWEAPLPRDMLYQLVIYARSSEGGGRAVILYPTLHSEAQDACVQVTDPILGQRRGEVILRPVNLDVLARLVSDDSGAEAIEKSRDYARALALGAKVAPH